MKDNGENRFLMSEDGQKTFTYYAFISYKHSDIHWARWLQKRLESYRLPSAICEQEQVPRQVSPLFRDETDITVGKTVKDHLVHNVSLCKHLIVICSRHMQQDPEYVDLEIETFLSLGNHTSNILPVIVDGEANAKDPSLECLPPALKALGNACPLGVNLDRKTRKLAIIKLVASMLQLDLHTLVNHERIRRQKQLVVGMLGALVVMTLFGTFMAWQFLRVSEMRLREQNMYALQTYRQGDRIRAEQISGQVLDGTFPLMDASITSEARHTRALSELHGKYLPLTSIGEAGDRRDAMFAADGQSILLYDSKRVTWYNTEGESTGVFSVSQTGKDEIAVISPDGVHAVLMSVRSKPGEQTALWLWDIRHGEQVLDGALAASIRYDSDEWKKGVMNTVVEAHFNGDGSLLCAYCKGGFFNSNDVLTVRDGETGAILASADATLLGRRDSGGNIDGVVKDFSFLTNRVAHWQGSSNHVFYDSDTSEWSVVPKAELVGYDAVGEGRYAMKMEDRNLSVLDLAVGQSREWEVPEDWILDRSKVLFTGGHYVTLAFADSDGRSIVLLSIDLRELELVLCQYLGKHGYEDLAMYPNADGSRIYLDATETRLISGKGERVILQADLQQGTLVVCDIDAPIGGDMRVLGAAMGCDVLAFRKQDQTMLCECSAVSASVYLLDETFDSFTNYAVLSGSEAPVLLAWHADAWFLYPTVHPGEALPGQETSEQMTCWAVSRDGHTLAAAFERELCVWRDNDLLFRQSMDKKVLHLDVTTDGSRIAAVDADSIHLFDDTGGALGICEGPVNSSVSMIRLMENGERLLVLSTPAIRTKWHYETLYYNLSVYDTTDCRVFFEQPEAVYCLNYAEPERYVSVSEDGKRYAAIEMVAASENEFARTLTVRNAENGSIRNRTYSDDSMNFTYVKYVDADRLLTGWSSGAWLMNDSLDVVSSLKDPNLGDNVPILLTKGYLLTGEDLVRVWDMRSSQRINNLPVSGETLCLDEAEEWLFVGATDQTWAIRTDNWQTTSLTFTTHIEPIYRNESFMLYAVEGHVYRAAWREP